MALALRTKILFSASSLGGEALSQSRSLWLVYYYAPPEDADLRSILPLGVVGGLLFAANLAGALDDPLVGYWSDRTRSRLGRRLPFVLGATPLWALFAFLLFTPPANAGVAVTAAYFFLVLEAYHLFSTLSGGPYESLLPELARTSAERVSVAGIKVYFGAAGGLLGLVGSGLIVDRLGFEEMALVMALCALLFRYVGMAGVWRHASRTQPPARIPLREAMRETFSNRPFLAFLPTFVLFQIGLQLLLGVLPFLVKGVLGVEDEGTWVAILTGSAIVTALVAIPVLFRIAMRTSKRQAYRYSMLAAAAIFPLLFFAGFLPGIPPSVQLVVVVAMAGLPLAGVYLFPAPLTADIIDYDEARTGLRREATYFGTQNFVEKAATSLAPLFLVLLLALGDSSEDPLGMRLVGPVAGLVVFGAFLTFRSYDLPDEVLPPPAEHEGGAPPVRRAELRTPE